MWLLRLPYPSCTVLFHLPFSARPTQLWVTASRQASQEGGMKRPSPGLPQPLALLCDSSDPAGAALLTRLSSGAPLVS